jgi:lipoprotein-anchoring transpeptidase ErfK/SrfK
MRKAISLLTLGVLLILSAAPVARAQALEPRYFPATGHTLDDNAGFMSFWAANDGERLIGLPISEPIQGEAGWVQYFERARLEQQRDPRADTLVVVAAPVAREYVEALYRSFAAPPRRADRADVRFFTETGYSLRAPFRSFWEGANGAALFGAPISEPIWETTGAGRRLVQYFRNVRLERDASMAGTPDEIVVSDLGRGLAALRGIDTRAIDNPGYAEAGPAAPLAANVAAIGASQAPPPAPPTPPAPSGQPAAPATPRVGGKSILVNLSEQWLYAYEGGELIFDAPVATGRNGMETPTGTYAIYAKLKVQTMDGYDNGEYWVVPNVPNVMYINGGVALHGTYWHNLFGTGARPSHGCVNLPLKAAAWLYGWAPMGTTVRVTY